MSVSEPGESFPARGKGGSRMRLPLHSDGDHNGNAFPVSSSSSSSSCPGELSPESLRSLSSLSGGGTDSPLDYDMFEVTLTTTVITNTDETADDVISKWVPQGDSEADDSGDVLVEKVQTAVEVSESNDTSASVYLECCQDTWNDNDNLTLALSLTANDCSQGDNDDLSSGSGRRHDWSTLDSDATEVPADDDDEDDEDEALFLSVSSEAGLQRSSMTLTCSTSQYSTGLVIPGAAAELHSEETMALSVADDKIPELVLEGPEAACPLDLLMDSQTEPPAIEVLGENIQISSSYPSTVPAQDSKEITSPKDSEKCPAGCKPTRPNTSQPARVAKPKPTTTTSTAPKTSAATGIKPSSVEAKKVSKPGLKNVKAKVGSRPTPTPPKTPSQSKSALANGKKAAPRREEAQIGDGGKSQRSPADPVKVVVVLKPIRGKSNNLKTNHKAAAACDSAEPDKRSVAVSRALSASTGSLGSEVVEEGPVDTPGQAVQEVPYQQGTAESAEATHPSEDVGEESVDEPMAGTGDVMMTEAAAEKPRIHSRKVSSKLGPNARQLGKGTRGDKASGPAPPPGSGAGHPGQGSPGHRQAQIEGSMLGEVGHCGSPTRVRQSQSQSQGIPKPRTSIERGSALNSLVTASAIFKPTANQQPAVGSAVRPAVPAASKLPVKGLPTSLGSLSVGSHENNGATGKAPPAPTGTMPDERPSRSMCPLGSQTPAKPPSSGTTATPGTSTPGDTVSTAAPKPLVMRTRAMSLQARTTATGLKAPAATNHITGKMTAASQTAAKAAPSASQGLTKQASQYPLQRSGSARLSRLNSAVWAQQLCMTDWLTPVDKNKPREAPARPANTHSSSQAAAPARGNGQNQLQPPPDLVPDVVKANSPATPALPVLVAEVTNTGSGTTGASGLGFKARTASRSSPKAGSRVQNASKPGVARVAAVDGTTVTAKQNQSKEQAEKKNQAINQLRKLLVQGNKRVEALATVIQHLFTEREESVKQKKELSLELANLRDELVTSSQCCERLQNEREEVRVSLEEASKRLQEQHKEELVQLEDRLRSFYQTEWDKVHQTYQEEADKCRMLMEQQVEELRNQQEAERKNQEVNHSQNMESLKQQYETSIQELKRIQQTDLENLEKTLTQTETSLSEKITELSAEKEALNERLQAEEERRKRILTDKNLKDSHTVYLEQELDSLKVVLEIKNNQLHQKEKKLMEMDKLVETNVKLEECMRKVQQENEDYKARMDKHAALSKQLSSEQVILQQTLQKESKVNKRLSMENEELLWKLHNGDLLASPRRLSPTSPFSSPRNSASFPTTAPLSPR
ncbi:microtubule-associated tumor suppressor 1 homolog isoform X2 [Scophthalmus maximus]|uniref:microtubule-associated tumor suppressor 1 homolog isoform X2 n=1 Tax=Scophthalmus maximus TaxID=52904 RepID=UPI001FA92B27|nr:microtubule-associated tumor suppressor 1 homolog isoform X2 [Scophthalmus maximus]